MEPREGTVYCAEHGEHDATFVCSHLVSGMRLGFFTAEDPGNPRPDAWCGRCERLRLQHGGAWPEEVERTLGVTLQCSACYDEARARNIHPPV
jgi:hypothetical protein